MCQQVKLAGNIVICILGNKPTRAIITDEMDSCHKVISAFLFPPPQEVILGQLSICHWIPEAIYIDPA